MWKEGHGAGVVNQHNPAALQSPAHPRHSERPSQSRLAKENRTLAAATRTHSNPALSRFGHAESQGACEVSSGGPSSRRGVHRAAACIARRRLLRRRTWMPLPPVASS